jgi:hypothetical protein
MGTRPTDTPFLAILAVFLQMYVIVWQAKLCKRKVGACNSDARNSPAFFSIDGLPAV